MNYKNMVFFLISLLLTGRIFSTHTILPRAIPPEKDDYLLAISHSYHQEDVSLFGINDRGFNFESTVRDPSAQSPQSLAFSSDGKHLAVANLSTDNISFCEVSDKKITLIATYPNPSRRTRSRLGLIIEVVFSFDGNYLAIVNQFPAEVSLYEVTNSGLVLIGTYNDPKAEQASSIAFSPDSRYIAVANFYSKNISLFEVSNRGLTLIGTYADPEARGLKAVSFSPDGKYLATANLQSSNVSFFEVNTGELNLIGTYNDHAAKWPTAIAFSPDGKYLGIANDTPDHRGGTVSFFKVSTRELILMGSYSDPGADYLLSIAFSPDSKRISIANYASNNISYFSVTERGLILINSYGSPGMMLGPRSLAFSPSLKKLG